jgi:hypothetical protein
MDAGCLPRIQSRRRGPIGVRWWSGRQPCGSWVSGGYARGRPARRGVGALARAPPTRHVRRELGGDFCPAPLGNVEGAELPRWRVATPVVPIHDGLPCAGRTHIEVSSRVLRICRSIGERRRPQSSPRPAVNLPRMDDSSLPMDLGARNRPRSARRWCRGSAERLGHRGRRGTMPMRARLPRAARAGGAAGLSRASPGPPRRRSAGWLPRTCARSFRRCTASPAACPGPIRCAGR